MFVIFNFILFSYANLRPYVQKISQNIRYLVKIYFYFKNNTNSCSDYTNKKEISSEKQKKREHENHALAFYKPLN